MFVEDNLLRFERADERMERYREHWVLVGADRKTFFYANLNTQFLN